MTRWPLVCLGFLLFRITRHTLKQHCIVYVTQRRREEISLGIQQCSSFVRGERQRLGTRAALKCQAILEDEETVSFGAMPPAPSRKIIRGSNADSGFLLQHLRVIDMVFPVGACCGVFLSTRHGKSICGEEKFVIRKRCSDQRNTCGHANAFSWKIKGGHHGRAQHHGKE